MYASTLFFTAILALARFSLAATPPACLIAALGAQSNPSDLKSLCGTLEQQVAGNITEKCSGGAGSSAMSVFSATCLASESVTIKITSSSSSSSGSKTKSVSATTTGSESSQATATGSSGSRTTGIAASTGTSTGTSSGSTASTNSKSSGVSSVSQPAFIIAPLIVAAGFVQYLL